MRVVLTGASGQLGPYLLERLLRDGHDVDPWSGSDRGERCGRPLRPVDLTDEAATLRALIDSHPAVVIHAAAISTADAVRRDLIRAYVVNARATRTLAEWCARRGRRFVYTSTDLVFNGTRAPYRETDGASPVLAYGTSKLWGENETRSFPGTLVARLSLLYGPARGGRVSYFDRSLDAWRRGEPQTFFLDEFRTPLDYPTAANILARLAFSDVAGIIHVGGPERLSRFDLARRAAAALGFSPDLVRANRQSDADSPEPRPADVSLDISRLASLFPDLRRPTVEEAVAAMDRTP